MISIDQIFKSATIEEWYDKLLGFASTLKLPTTAWQPGGVTRTIFAVMARAFNFSDGLVTNGISSVFLDFAAAVTVEGGPGALDLLAEQTFNVFREVATQGTTTIDITNAGADIGPFLPGTYHVEIPATGHTYTNKDVFTIATGANPAITFVCDQFGVSDASLAVAKAVSSYAGVTLGTTNGVAVGRPIESNASLLSRCKLKLASLGPKLGGKKSIEFFAVTTKDENGNPLPDYPLPAAPITRVRLFVDEITGAIRTVIANASTAPPSGGDVALMQAYLVKVGVADGDVNTTAACGTTSIDFNISIWCPASYAPHLTADVTLAIGDFCSITPIGGEATEDSVDGFSREEFELFLGRRLAYIRIVKAALNAGFLSVAMGSDEIPNPGTIVVNRIGV